jgi:hypothetical protein
MTGQKIIHEIPPHMPTNPGYQLLGQVSKNLDKSKTLTIASVVPGAAHPDPHVLVSVTLPPEGFSRLIKLLEPHAKP